jgi:flavin-binding protein dodecin
VIGVIRDKFEGDSVKSLEEAIRDAVLQATIAVGGIDHFRIFYLGADVDKSNVKNFKVRVEPVDTRLTKLIPEKDIDDLESGLVDSYERLDELESRLEDLEDRLQQLREQYVRHCHQVQSNGYPMTTFPLAL